MSLPPQQLFAEIYRIHGHRCPMSTLGGRLGFAARAHLAGRAPLTATYFIDTCAADGISVMTGCSRASNSLRIIARNRHALWLQGKDGAGIFAELTDYALHLAGEYRLLDLKHQQEGVGLDLQAERERRQAKELYLDELLHRLWSLPDDRLMILATDRPTDIVGATD